MNLNSILNQMQIQHRCIGNQEFETLGLADAEPDVPFCTYISDLKYASAMGKNAALVLTDEELSEKICCAGICVVHNPRYVYFTLHNFLAGYSDYNRSVCETVIGKNCRISPSAVIADKNVVIGSNVIIEEFVSIKENVVIGDNCIIRAGSVLGGEGFEFKRDEQNNLFGIRHLGGVVLQDSVEIQQNSCIDRAVYPWDDTRIGRYSKIDDLVYIAHGVKIGRNTLIAARSAIGGRTIIGDDCWIGLGVSVRNGIKIGSKSRANMGAVVTKDIPAGEAVTGNFAIPHEAFLKNLKSSANL